MSNSTALINCKNAEDVDPILVNLGYTTTEEKCKFLWNYMGAGVSCMGDIDIETQYDLTKMEFIKGYWRVLNGK